MDYFGLNLTVYGGVPLPNGAPDGTVKDHAVDILVFRVFEVVLANWIKFWSDLLLDTDKKQYKTLTEMPISPEFSGFRIDKLLKFQDGQKLLTFHHFELGSRQFQNGAGICDSMVIRKFTFARVVSSTTPLDAISSFD